jgi:hypothetical protein
MVAVSAFVFGSKLMARRAMGKLTMHVLVWRISLWALDR